MVKPTRLQIAEQIAKRITKTLTKGEVTVEQVAMVASGQDQCESHPVIAQIRAACRKAGILVGGSPR